MSALRRLRVALPSAALVLGACNSLVGLDGIDFGGDAGSSSASEAGMGGMLDAQGGSAAVAGTLRSPVNGGTSSSDGGADGATGGADSASGSAGDSGGVEPQAGTSSGSGGTATAGTAGAQTDGGAGTGATAGRSAAGGAGAGGTAGAGARQHRVTVERIGSGAGSIDSSPLGIDCSGTTRTCSALFDEGTNVVLRARTQNGSASFFSGWSGAGCAGPYRDCALTVTQPVTVTGNFSPMTNNLVFVTSHEFPTTLGGAAAYEDQCNLAASAGGINNAAGNAFIAFVSDSTSVATTRMPGARGWVRMDGKPFADSQQALFQSNQVFSSIRFDEFGNEAPKFMLSGTTSQGQLGRTCGDWKTECTSDCNGGWSDAGPGLWGGAGLNCAGPRRLSVICMGNTKSAPVPPLVTTGLRIWTSLSAYRVGMAQTPDEKCQLEKPAGVTNAAALITTSDRSAASVLDSTASYVRPDGTLVGTGAQLLTGNRLESGIWQFSDGTYNVGFGVWTGAGAYPFLANSNKLDTCDDWTDSLLGAGRVGLPVSTLSWWFYSTSSCAAVATRLYCVEVKP